MSDDTAFPDPDDVADLAEFIEALGRLRMWSGAPSYRTLAKRVGPLLRVPQTVPASTLIDVFKSHRRRLDIDLVVAIVRALGRNEAETARWRSACVRVHRQARVGGPAGVLRQLPPDPATFTGRDEALKELIGAAVSRVGPSANTVVVSAIEGMGGVGKTQLAVHAAHELVRAGRFAEMQLYANLRGFDPEQPPADPAAVLDAFLRQLGVPAQQVPAALDERAAMFRDRTHGRDALIVLDNAADAKQVRDLIPASPTCLVLITSRRGLAELEGAALHVLDVFTVEEALDLLSAVVGADRVRAEPEAARRIVQACGFLPLAVSIAASRLRARPAWTLEDMARRLDDGLDALATRDRALRPVFDLSYQASSEAAQRVFRLLSLHPGAHFSVPSVAALAGCPQAVADGLLETLADENLLQQRVADRYELHDLLKRYAAELVGDEPAVERDAAVARLATWYLHTVHAAAVATGAPDLPDLTDSVRQPTVFASGDDALAWLDQERATVVAVQRTAVDHELHEIAWQLAVCLKAYFTVRHHLADYEATHSLALASARAVDDQRAEAQILAGLGGAYWRLGRLEEAESFYRRAAVLSRTLGDQGGEAAACLGLGCVHGSRARQEEAIAAFREAMAALEDPGPGALRTRALCHMNVGTALYQLGRFTEAVESHRRALADIRLTGDRRSEAIVLYNVAEVHSVLGEFDLAVALCQESHDLSLAIGADLLRAEALLIRGDIHQRMDNPEQARQAWNESLELFDLVESPSADQARKRLSE